MAVSYLSSVEQSVLDEINLARTNPNTYADILAQRRQYYQGNLLKLPGQISLLTNEGVAALDEAISVLRSTSPLPALSPSQGMSLGAKDHVNDTGPKGIVGHIGTDGSDPTQRVNRYGQGFAGENIDYGPSTGRDIVIDLIVDDGVSSRGHRANILRSSYQFAGVSVGPHAQYGTMAVINFADQYKDSLSSITPPPIPTPTPTPITITPPLNDNPQTLRGTAENDTLQGNSGTYTLYGGKGNDLLEAGSGNSDAIYGYGGKGNDILIGGLGNDLLSAGKNDDNLTGNGGIDTLTGGVGSDTFGLSSSGLAVITDFDLASDFIELLGDLNGSSVLVAPNDSNSLGVYVSNNGGSSFDIPLATLTGFTGDTGSVAAKIIGGNGVTNSTPTPTLTPTPTPTPSPTPSPNPSPSSSPSSTGTPGLDPEERAALDYLNSARQNPQVVGQQLGIDLSGVTPRPPLTPDPILNRVAQQRVDDFVARNYFDHVDPDGLGPNIKVERAGYPLPSFYLDNPANNFIESLGSVQTIGNVSGFPTSGSDIIKNLLIDTGTSPPGHRIHLLDLNDFYAKHTDVGIGYTSVTQGDQTNYYMAVLTAYKG